MKKAWIISVNMGYGHQRTAFPLKELAPEGKIINANDYQGISESDRKVWEGMRSFYEFISNFKRIPLIGNIVFSFFDKIQRIISFYPKKDLSKPNLQLKQNFFLIKKGWGKHLIEKLNSYQDAGGKKIPLISTFFTPAFMAEYFGYSGEIFCVVCDADISRTWAPLTPESSKIKYFAPNSRVVERLKLYGVKPENIFLTGYPLPKENITGESSANKLAILKKDLSYRLLNLDPQKEYFKNYEPLIKNHLGKLPKRPNHTLTVTFAVGGAGAQKEIGMNIAKNLAGKIKTGQVKLILVAGIRKRVKDYFLEKIKNLKLEEEIDKNLKIIFAENIESYFRKFNQVLRTTDILWTKPSELSFYSALGLPIIVAPTIGSQEEFNKRWLLKSGFGILQENPKYTSQWLFDWLERGYLAECAMQGYIEGEKLGTQNIKKIISTCPGF